MHLRNWIINNSLFELGKLTLIIIIKIEIMIITNLIILKFFIANKIKIDDKLIKKKAALSPLKKTNTSENTKTKQL